MNRCRGTLRMAPRTASSPMSLPFSCVSTISSRACAIATSSVSGGDAASEQPRRNQPNMPRGYSMMPLHVPESSASSISPSKVRPSALLPQK